MRKGVIGGGLLAAIAVGGYSAFWYMEAQKIEENTNAMLNGLQRDISTLGQKSDVVMAFSHGAMEVTGYPLRHDVVIHTPKLTIDDKRKNAKVVWSLGQLRFSHQINQPGHIQVFGFETQQLESIGEVGTAILNMTYQEPVMSMDFDAADQKLRTFHYADNGMNVTESESGEKVASSAGSQIDFTRAPQSAQREIISLKFNVDQFETSDFFLNSVPESEQELMRACQYIGTSDIDWDVTYDGPTDSQSIQPGVTEAKLDIRSLKMQFGDKGFDAKGVIEAQAGDPMPVANLTLHVLGYELFLKSLQNCMKVTEEYSNMANAQPGTVHAAPPLLTESAMMAEEARKFLLFIANDEELGPDIDITIVREKGGMPQIGRRSFMEVMEYFQQASKRGPIQKQDVPRQQIPVEPATE